MALAKIEPCGGEYVAKAIMGLFPVFPQPERTTPEWSAFWRVYKSALADLPAFALDKAITDAVNLPEAEFIPKPGPLRAMAMNRARDALQAAYIARRAANSLPRKAPSEEDRKRVAAMMAELAQSLTGKKKPPAEAEG